MAKSRAGRSAAGRSAAGGGGRAQTIAVFLVILMAGALLGSLVVGLLGGDGPAPPASTRRSGEQPTPTERVRVEVLNASGRAGLAREGTRVLRDSGFDVVYFGNAAGFAPDTSMVLDRVGRLEAARRVADALGIRRVMARPDSNLVLDATVVLGRDWQPDTTTAAGVEEGDRNRAP